MILCIWISWCIKYYMAGLWHSSWHLMGILLRCMSGSAETQYQSITKFRVFWNIWWDDCSSYFLTYDFSALHYLRLSHCFVVNINTYTFTVRRRSSGKIMFPQMSICTRGEGGLGTSHQGGHGTGKTGKTGNLVLTFSRQGKHREFCSDTGKNLPTQGKYLDCDY